MGDFNIDILQYDNNKDSEHFLDEMCSNFLLPYITSSSRVTSRSKTLINNISLNVIEEDTNSGIITTTTSDHYTEFALFKNKHCSMIEKKLNSIEISWQLIKKDLSWTPKMQTGVKFWKLKIEILMVLLTNFLKDLTTFLINMHS